VSELLDYIVSGSEDGFVYLWDCVCDQGLAALGGGVGGAKLNTPFHKQDRINSYEYFSPFGEDHPSNQVPVAIFAPNETVKL
jgi:hypothetical protein